MRMHGQGRRISLVALILFVVMAAGCNPQATAEPIATPVKRPDVTAAPEKNAAPPVERYIGYTVRVKPAHGPELLLAEPIAAQLILDAFTTQRLHVEGATGRFDNRLEVLNPQGEAEHAFSFSSDGEMLMRYGDGRTFHMPEYIFYLLEDNLWSYGGTLMQDASKWKPDEGTAVLELELPRLIKTALFPAFGYAEAYFASYRIYGVNTSTRNVAKVYVLLTFAGYRLNEGYFSPAFLHTTPATLIFDKEGAAWRLTALKRPAKAPDKSQLYNTVREIFPYDYMEDVLADLKDPTAQVRDIVRQATEYLNEIGISGVTVDG